MNGYMHDNAPLVDGSPITYAHMSRMIDDPVYRRHQLRFGSYDSWAHDVRACTYIIRSRQLEHDAKVAGAKRASSSSHSRHNKDPLHVTTEFVKNPRLKGVDVPAVAAHVMKMREILKGDHAQALENLLRHTRKIWPPGGDEGGPSESHAEDAAKAAAAMAAAAAEAAAFGDKANTVLEL